VENLLLVEARPMILTSLKNHNGQMLLCSEALNSAVKVKEMIMMLYFLCEVGNFEECLVSESGSSGNLAVQMLQRTWRRTPSHEFH